MRFDNHDAHIKYYELLLEGLSSIDALERQTLADDLVHIHGHRLVGDAQQADLSAVAHHGDHPSGGRSGRRSPGSAPRGLPVHLFLSRGQGQLDRHRAFRRGIDQSRPAFQAEIRLEILFHVVAQDQPLRLQPDRQDLVREQVGSIGYTVRETAPQGKLVDAGYFTYPACWNQGYTGPDGPSASARSASRPGCGRRSEEWAGIQDPDIPCRPATWWSAWGSFRGYGPGPLRRQRMRFDNHDARIKYYELLLEGASLPP